MKIVDIAIADDLTGSFVIFKLIRNLIFRSSGQVDYRLWFFFRTPPITRFFFVNMNAGGFQLIQFWMGSFFMHIMSAYYIWKLQGIFSTEGQTEGYSPLRRHFYTFCKELWEFGLKWNGLERDFGLLDGILFLLLEFCGFFIDFILTKSWSVLWLLRV